MSDVKVTLAHKKNIRDAEVKKPEHLAKIKKATGVDYEFVVEPKVEDFALAVIKCDNRYHEKFGNGLYGDDGYLAAIATLLEKACKDDMVKEAVVDATSAKKIVLRKDEEVYNKIEFKDGCLVVLTTADYFYFGVANLQNIDVAQLL